MLKSCLCILFLIQGSTVFWGFNFLKVGGLKPYKLPECILAGGKKLYQRRFYKTGSQFYEMFPKRGILLHLTYRIWGFLHLKRPVQQGFKQLLGGVLVGDDVFFQLFGFG